MKKEDLLTQWANLIIQNCHSGALIGEPIPISQVFTISGPRAGALEIHAGVQSGKLLRVLSKDKGAMMRQFIPWHFVGEPACFLSSRYVRLEAGFPDSLAEKDIRLRELGERPKGAGRWIAGKNENGQTVTLGLDDSKPSWLVSGTTGSGKSFAMRSAISQLCQDPTNRLILIDGKWGEGLGPLAHVRGLVGPMAIDVETARLALSWAASEMRRRYENPNGQGRLIIVCDEVQEICQDPQATDLLRRLVCQGRAAQVHTILGTQHPVIAMFGNDPSIKRNLPGRLALKVLDAKSSEVAVGASQPRADYLLGTGDSYCITPSACHRAQLAYVPENELAGLPHVDPLLEEWPDFDPECVGTLPEPEAVTGFDATETAISLICAHYRKGRPFLKRMLEETTGNKPGSGRAGRLLAWGKDVNAIMHQLHHKLSLTA